MTVVSAPSQRWISAVAPASVPIARGSGRTRAPGRGTVLAGGVRVVSIASPPRSGVGGGGPRGPAPTSSSNDGAPKSTRRPIRHPGAFVRPSRWSSDVPRDRGAPAQPPLRQSDHGTSSWTALVHAWCHRGSGVEWGLRSGGQRDGFGGLRPEAPRDAQGPGQDAHRVRPLGSGPPGEQRDQRRAGGDLPALPQDPHRRGRGAGGHRRLRLPRRRHGHPGPRRGAADRAPHDARSAAVRGRRPTPAWWSGSSTSTSSPTT